MSVEEIIVELGRLTRTERETVQRALARLAADDEEPNHEPEDLELVSRLARSAVEQFPESMRILANR